MSFAFGSSLALGFGGGYTRVLRDKESIKLNQSCSAPIVIAAMSDHAKRTRSQLSLPDEFGDVHLGISPLKAARQEWRKNVPVASPLVHAPPNVAVSDNDELLFSHHDDRPQKRTSPQPQVSSLEDDAERQFKRLKKDHNEGDGPHHAHDLHPEESRITETTQPSGPFDFSAISPKDLLSPTRSTQLGASWTKRAQSVPLVSPSVSHRDLGQLMPSPLKAAPVSPVRETLRFSSLPSTFEHLADGVVIRNVGRSPTESEREKDPPASHTLPTLDETVAPLREKPTTAADTLCNDQFPAAAPSLEVTASDVSPTGPLLPLDVRACVFQLVNHIHFFCAVLCDDAQCIAKGTRQRSYTQGHCHSSIIPAVRRSNSCPL